MIVAGFGYRAAAGEASLRDALDDALKAAGAARAGAVAALEEKAGHPAVGALAAALGIRLIAVARNDAAGQDTRTRSRASRAARGLDSVAEAVALAACGPGARLLAPRVVSGDGLATCALAEGEGT